MNQTAKKSAPNSKQAPKASAQVFFLLDKSGKKMPGRGQRGVEKLYSQQIGKRIRMARAMFGNKSQDWLGKQLGLTFQQIQKMEKGTNRASGARLVQIARILHVSIDFFYEGLDTGNSKTPVLSTFEIKVCQALKGMTNKAEQIRFLKLARIMGMK